MYKVLRILNRFNLGGPSYNAGYLTKYLRGEYRTLLVGGPPRRDEADSYFIFEKLGVEPLVLQEMSPYVSLRSEVLTFRRLSEIIDDYRPDIVHTHASRAGIIGRFTANIKKVPVIVHTFHGHHFSGYVSSFVIKIYRELERYLSKISTAVIAISEKQKDELVRIYRVVPEEKCYVIPLGFDLSRFVNISADKVLRFKERFCIPEDRVVISIIGRFAPIKNHKLLVEAVSLLPRNLLEKILVLVVGDGELREDIVKLVSKKGLEKVFKFTSWVKDVSVVLGSSDIVVLTSLNEGTPVSLIEAQAAGLPVISTDVGGVSDVVKDGETGLLVPSNSSGALANAIVRLVEDSELRRRFGEAGRNYVLKKYSYTRLVEDIRKLYSELLFSRGVI